MPYAPTLSPSWEIFQNMYRYDRIRVLAKNITPSSSEEEEHIEKDEKTNDEEMQDIQARQEQRGKGAKAKLLKPKTMGGTMAQTPQKKDCRIKQRGLKSPNKGGHNQGNQTGIKRKAASSQTGRNSFYRKSENSFYRKSKNSFYGKPGNN